MFNPDTSPQAAYFMRAIEAAALLLGVAVTTVPVRSRSDIEPALEGFARQPNGGLILPTDSFTRLHQTLTTELSGRFRLPSISYASDFAKDGGLMNYGSSFESTRQFGRAAIYVDRILKGAKPGDLPVQGADRFNFVVNLKTAKALGLTVPLPLLGLADEVIE